MSDFTDIAVIGLGIAGSAIAAHLSAKYRVTGIDRFQPPHVMGSSHGENRIIRGAPGEGAAYAYLASRAFTLFPEIEQLTGRRILHVTGGIDAATLPSMWAREVRGLCGELHLPFEMMSGAAFNRRFGNFALPASADVVLQAQFGYVDAEGAWQAFLDLARHNGANLRFGADVADIRFGDPCRIRFQDGSLLEAGHVVIAAGGWLPRLLDLDLPLRVERRVLAWYPLERSFGPLLPFCFSDGDRHFWYGMPTLDGRGIKIGEHHHFREIVDPDAVPPVSARDTELLDSFIVRHMRGIRPEAVRTATCKYTLTPTGDFIFDRHPEHANVLVVSCCSGHGFKYAPVYGEIAESLLEGRDYGIDLAPFALSSHLAG